MVMSADQSVSLPVQEGYVMNLETEFVNHLATVKGAEFAIRDGVSEQLIYTPKNKAIFAFVQHYYSETGQVPTDVVLKTEFGIEISPVTSTINWVVDKLRDRYKKNEVQDLVIELAKTKDTPDKAMDLLAARTLEIQQNTSSTRYVWSAGDSKLFLSGLQDKILEGHYQGIPIGFDPIDNFTGGLKKSYLAFLVARPKRMKTFFICNAFIQQKLAGVKPMLVTMENTEEEVMLRISCLLSGYPWDLAQRGVYTPEAWALIEQTWDAFDAMGPHWIVRPPEDERTVPAIALQADKFGADSLIVSQFSYLQPTNPTYYSRPDHEKWGSIVMDLKGAASRPGKERPILVEAQVNREGDKLEDFSDMSLSQLGLTDKIGQVSDIVYALYQNKEMRDSQRIQFGIIEARNSDKHNWNIHTEFKTQTYLEVV